MEGKYCDWPGHKGLDAWLITAFGLAFLLQNLQVITPELANIIWPSVIVLYGIKNVI